MSSNISVRQVAACSLAAEELIYFSESQLRMIQTSKLHFTAVSAGNDQWDPNQKSSLSQRAATTLADLFQKHNLRPDDLLSDWFEAAKHDYTNVLAFLYHVWNIPVDSIHEKGWTALTSSMLYGNYDTAKLLLEWGANPNMITIEKAMGETALTVLCGKEMDDKSLDIGRLLLGSGADVNLRGPGVGDLAPLYTAASSGNIETVKWLIENGADIDMIGGPWGSALHIASFSDHAAMVEILLEHGAIISLKNGWGVTALDVAVSEGSKKSALVFREHM